MDPEDRDLIVQALVFFATVDVSADTNPKLTLKALNLAEKIKDGNKISSKPFVTYNHGLISEDPYIKDRVINVLEN